MQCLETEWMENLQNRVNIELKSLNETYTTLGADLTRRLQAVHEKTHYLTAYILRFILPFYISHSLFLSLTWFL